MKKETFNNGDSLCICIATYRRDEGLARLLKSLGVMNGINLRKISVIVVDNSGEGKVRKICREFSHNTGLTTNCYIENTRGLSFARNRALRELPGDADFVAFLDDDEVVDKNWLNEMVKAVKVFPADVWSGPVVSRYPECAPQWIIQGGFFDRRIRHDGEERDTANTGNIMFKRSVLRRVSPWFSSELAFSGGEDTDYFFRVHKAGMKIVWVKNAIVFEFVGAERVRLNWIVKQNYTKSATNYRIQVFHDSSLCKRLTLFAKACARLGQGILLSPMLLAAPFRLDWALKAVLPVIWSAGYLAGLLGIKSRLY